MAPTAGKVPRDDISVPALFDVRGLVVVITGGGTGIGLMMAKALENSGAIVYILGRRQNKLEAAAKDNNKYKNIIPVACDITSQRDLLAAVAAIKARSGHINLLINNAGVANNVLPKALALRPSSALDEQNIPSPISDASSSLSGSVENTQGVPITSLQAQLWSSGTPADFAQSFAVNSIAPYYTTVAFLELLDAGNRSTWARTQGVTSQVITVSSGGGFRRDAKVFSISYTLSKAASIHLGKMLTDLLGGWNIRSNVFCPGIFPSDMVAFLTPEQMRAGVPLGRTGDMKDVAGVILFMASRAGAYMNGNVQMVDGGRLSLFSSTY